jgi:cobalt-precorrin 5A hydrolase/precorrin-3B C17-methyltransferase
MVTESKKNIAIFAISRNGIVTGRHLKSELPDSHLFMPAAFAPEVASSEYPIAPNLKISISWAFRDYRHLILIMSTGIAVRMIAAVLKDKRSDPAVVVVDQNGVFAVSLLSGHLGGANRLTQETAAILGSLPVITTASEIMGTLSPDILGKEQGWEIENPQVLTRLTAALINGEPTGLYQEAGEPLQEIFRLPLPHNLLPYSSLADLLNASLKNAIIISDKILKTEGNQALPENCLIYRPKCLVAGIGCNRGTAEYVIAEAVKSIFEVYGLSLRSLKNIATIAIKQNEVGISEFAHHANLPVDYFNRSQLRAVETVSPPSASALKYAGVPSVSEAAAILSAGQGLIVTKEIFAKSVTVAVARCRLVPLKKARKGHLSIVGTGPGSPQLLSLQAKEALAQSEIVVGYKTYIDLIRPLLVQKEIIATGMGAEIERMQKALTLARQGRRVALVSSGDAGIYGMAGLLGEMLTGQITRQVDIEVIPGIPALASGAALLGAPLTGDFACISLSDHLVEWDTIRRRLQAAAEADFVIVLYNPRSAQRPDYLAQARAILLASRDRQTPVGLVTNAFRSGQKVQLTTLGEMLDFNVNMNTTVFIGNKTTFRCLDWLVTPRGYRQKYELTEAQQ